jgi:hypothetical protein
MNATATKPDLRSTPKTGLLSNSFREMHLLCLKADTHYKDVARELGVDPHDLYLAFYRNSHRGRAGDIRRRAIEHLYARIRNAHKRPPRN